MPLVNEDLGSLSELELIVSGHLVIGEDVYVAHDLADLRELGRGRRKTSAQLPNKIATRDDVEAVRPSKHRISHSQQNKWLKGRMRVKEH